MGNYNHGSQRNTDNKMSQYGIVPHIPHVERSLSASDNSRCESAKDLDLDCSRGIVYLQRIVKSLLRQMNVHTHKFGPGEAITIDLQAELKYDDYITLTKFMNSKDGSDKYLYRLDEILSNFIHAVEHTSARFEFMESIINFPAFYSLKFWVILLTTMVTGSLIVMLFVKAFSTRAVHVQLIYGFLIIFIVSCVWTFSNLYQDKKAEMHSHMVQSSGLPPKDCDYQNWGILDSIWYYLRVTVSKNKDRCGEYYANTMTDPFWKVNPMEAISNSMAYFFLGPLGYVGERLGAFYLGFIDGTPFYLKPVLLMVAVFITILFIIGPFRISSPLLTIEPWRPSLPALDRNPVQFAISHERVRNEIMERPDGPVVKSRRDASTDMDGFHEYLTDEGSDELEIIGPFARFNTKSKPDNFVKVDTPQRNSQKESMSSRDFVDKQVDASSIKVEELQQKEEEIQYEYDKAAMFEVNLLTVDMENDAKVRAELLEDALLEEVKKEK